MGQTVRIFVSSPSDVPAERKAVERVASRVAGQFRHIEIEVYRWESGHYFSAHTGFQEQIEEIGGFDLVVGILWSRLGSPLPLNFGATMPPPREGQPYPSGTAFEILEAIRWRTERGAETPDVLVYQKRATAPSAPPDDHAAHEELDRQRKAIASFIQDFFSNPSDGIKGAFKSFNALSEFESTFENHLLAWLRENRSLARQRKWRVEELGSPFRGLDSFDAAHREVFFGRRREVGRARERLADGTGFLLIDGASGTGKSSLARAGLIPRMQDLDPDLRVAVTRPETDNPLTALAQALFETGSLPELADGDYTDATALGRHLAGGGDVTPILRALDRASQALNEREQRDSTTNLRLVLLVDQCEALFTNRVSAEEQRTYGIALEALVTSGRVQVIVTLRANAREAALAVPAFGRLIDGQQGLSLGWPTPDAFGEIVRGPAEAAGLGFERNDAGENLDEVLLREVVHDPDVLPLLQFALDQLYDKAVQRVLDGDAKLGDVPEGEPVLTLSHADYISLGGLSGAIGQQADAALRTVSDTARGRLPSLVRALTVAGAGTTVLGRAPVAIAVPDAATQELVEALLDARVLVRGVREDAGVAVDELRFAHERVLTAWERAREAVVAAQTFLRVRGELTRAEARWREGGRPSDLLLPAGLRVAEAENVLLEFGQELDRQHFGIRTYVQTSLRFTRMRQRLTQLAAVVFAGVAAAAGWFAYESALSADRADTNLAIAETNAARAEESAKEADEQRLAAERNAERVRAESTRAQDRLSALQRFKSEQLAMASFDALQGGRYDYALQLSTASFGPADEGWPSTTLSRSALRASFLQSGYNFLAPISTLRGHEGTVVGGLLTPDASAAVTWSFDKTARIWDASTGAQRHILDHEWPVLSAFFAKDDQLVTTGTGQFAMVWDMKTGTNLYKIEHAAPVAAGVFHSYTGNLVSADYDGNIVATSMTSGERKAQTKMPDAVQVIVPSPDDRTILIAGGSIALLDVATLEPIFELGVRNGETLPRYDRAEFVGENGTIVAWSSSGHVAIITSSGEPIVANHQFDNAVFGMIPFIEEGVLVFWTSEGIYRFDLENGEKSTLVEVDEENAIIHVVAVPNFPAVVWATLESKVQVASIDGKLEGALNLESPVVAIRDTQTSGHVLISGADRVVRAVSAHLPQGNENRIQLISRGDMEHDRVATRLGYAGPLRSSGGIDGTNRLWWPESNIELGRITHNGGYRGSHYSNNKLISWGDDPLAKIWAWNPNLKHTTEHEFTSGIEDVFVSAKNGTIIVLGDDDEIQLSKLGVASEVLEIELGFVAKDIVFDPNSDRFVAFSDEKYAVCSSATHSCAATVRFASGIRSLYWTMASLLLLDSSGTLSKVNLHNFEQEKVLDIGSNARAVELDGEGSGNPMIFLGDERAILLDSDSEHQWLEFDYSLLDGYESYAIVSPWKDYLFVDRGSKGGLLISLTDRKVTEFPEFSQIGLQPAFLSSKRMVIGDTTGGVWLVELELGIAEKVYEAGGVVRSVAALGESGDFAIVAGEPEAEIGIVFDFDGAPRAFFEVSDVWPDLIASEHVIITYSARSSTFTVFDPESGNQILRSISLGMKPKLLPENHLIVRWFESALRETSLLLEEDLLMEAALDATQYLNTLSDRTTCQISAFSNQVCDSNDVALDLARLIDKEGLSGGIRGVGNMLDVMPNPVPKVDGQGSSIDLEFAANVAGVAVLFHNSKFRDKPAFFYLKGVEGDLGVVMKDGMVRSFTISVSRRIMRLVENTRELRAVFVDPETGEATSEYYVPVRRFD